jgi:hypothetical protein
MLEALEGRRLLSTTPSQTLADQLVANIPAAHNTYSYGTPVVTWAGLNGATTYSNSSDCSTFITMLMEQAYGFTSSQITSWTGSSLPQSKDLFNAAVADDGFTGFTQIANLRVGDLMFMKYTDSSGDTGHCVTIDALPVTDSSKTTATQKAYDVKVVDCTADPHSNDTLINGETGVGSGYMVFYTDLTGNLTAWSWGESSESVVETQAIRPAIFAKMPPQTGTAWLSAGSSATWNSSSHALSITGPATIIADPGSAEPVITQSGSATQLLVMPGTDSIVHVGSLSLTNGATAKVYDPNGGSVLLDISPVSNNITIDSASQLDLAGNDLKVQSGSVSTLTALIARGMNAAGGANWKGNGITNSAAANDTTHLTALGIIQDTNGSGTIYPTFDGTTCVTTDVLIKSTYVGDANLDGKVDASDYSRLDNGYLNRSTLTGWYNGDFNYDGVINGSDYTLMDNAFNTQGPQVVFSPDSQIAIAGSEPIVTLKVAVPTFAAAAASPDELLKKNKAGAAGIRLIDLLDSERTAT